MHHLSRAVCRIKYTHLQNTFQLDAAFLTEMLYTCSIYAQFIPSDTTVNNQAFF